MHDIDRTQMELGHEGAFEAEGFEFAQQEYGHEFAGEYAGEYGNEVFGEAQEIQLANELLEVNSEAELNHFLGKLMKSASSAVGKVLSSPQIQAAGTALKGAATAALSGAAGAGLKAAAQHKAGQWGGSLGSSAGSWVGNKVGGWVGGDTGKKIADAATKYGGEWGKTLGSNLSGKLFDMARSRLGIPEGEIMEAEEMEFAGAQQFVRMAGDMIRRMQQARGNPVTAARSAALAAARQYIPGLLPGQHEYGEAEGEVANVMPGSSGTWVRRGNKIILYGV